MNSKEILATFLEEVLNQFEELKPLDIKNLESGDYSISLKIVKKKNTLSNKEELSRVQIKTINEKLSSAETREEGHSILGEYLVNKKQLEYFAKENSVYLMKQDRVKKMREKIVEGLIGARLRSNAIQRNQ